jgi:hypothetical protein
MKEMGKSSDNQQAYTIDTPRNTTRLAYFGNNASAGQLAISYGQPSWKDSYEEQVTSGKNQNRRWRLGQDFWTVLDTNVPVTIGDQKIPPGYYYMTLEQKGDAMVVAFLDPTEVRKQRLDAYVAHLTKGGIEVTMQHEKSDSIAKKLQIKLSVDEEDKYQGALTIKFGPHRLIAPLQVHKK